MSSSHMSLCHLAKSRQNFLDSTDVHGRHMHRMEFISEEAALQKSAAALLQTSAHQSDVQPQKTRTLSSRDFLTPSHTRANFSSQSPVAGNPSTIVTRGLAKTSPKLLLPGGSCCSKTQPGRAHDHDHLLLPFLPLLLPPSNLKFALEPSLSKHCERFPGFV